jgi:hypothetical protein
VKPTPPGASSSRAAPPQSLPIAGGAPERRHPVRHLSCRPSHPPAPSPRFGPLLSPSVAGEQPYELLFIPSIFHAPHPSPSMPRSPAIWSSRAVVRPSTVRHHPKSSHLPFVSHAGERTIAIPSIFSPFCISHKPLAVRNPADLMRQGQVSVREEFLSVSSCRLKKIGSLCA